MQMSFEPQPGGVRVSFVRGVDRFSRPPAFVKRAELHLRFAVVQHTDVEGCYDMFFDEALWRALAAFVQSQSPERRVHVATDAIARVPLDWFLNAWDGVAADEREPPPLLTAGSDARPTLCMITEYWTAIGGPVLYHDSYTYSLYSDQDVGDEVLAALARAPGHERWTLTPQIHEVKRASPPSLARRLGAWLTGGSVEG